MNAEQQNLFPGTHFISTVLDAAENKVNMTRNIAGVYIMRAAMAGFLIGIFYLANYAVVSSFTQISGDLAKVGSLVGAVIFGFALAFIYYSKSELLTSNMMITTIAVYHHRMKISRVAWLLILCFLGNFLGGLLIALFVSGSSVLDGAAGELVAHSVETKLSYITSGAGGVLDLFVRAILCNFLINISMLLVYNGLITTDIVKVLVMNVAVMLFAYLGFEHSVANTVLFTVQALNGGIDIWPAVGNVAVALVGNFLGGGILIGWYYAYANDASRRLRRGFKTDPV